MTDPLPDIESLIPHRGRMRLLDRVVSVEGGAMVAEGVVRGDNPFLQDGVMLPAALIEYMAQAMAALVSWRHGDPVPKMGYLVGARNVAFEPVTVAPGGVVRATVREEAVLGDFAAFDGVVAVDGAVACRGNLKVFRVQEESA
jgi:predicted hotdog family 3-hydroxylacyl-ACP dehydratase